MAIEVTERRICDINPAHLATRDLKVGLEGEWRLLDVCDSCHERATAAVGKYFECGRPANQKPTVIKKRIGANGEPAPDDDSPTTSQSASLPDEQLRPMVRKWANENDVSVSTRGKIAKTVYDAFFEAHPDLAQTPSPA